MEAQLAAQPREETWGITPSPRHGTTARPPQPRDGRHARHPHTGPGAEGGGGWPMHATAQPWHAEGRPLPNGALPVPAELLARLTSASRALWRRALKADW